MTGLWRGIVAMTYDAMQQETSRVGRSRMGARSAARAGRTTSVNGRWTTKDCCVGGAASGGESGGESDASGESAIPKESTED